MKMLVICILTTFDGHMTSIAKHFLSLFVGNKIDLPTVVYITLDISRFEAANCESFGHFLAGGNGFWTIMGEKQTPPFMWEGTRGNIWVQKVFFSVAAEGGIFFLKELAACGGHIWKHRGGVFFCLHMFAHELCRCQDHFSFIFFFIPTRHTTEKKPYGAECRITLERCPQLTIVWTADGLHNSNNEASRNGWVRGWAVSGQIAHALWLVKSHMPYHRLDDTKCHVNCGSLALKYSKKK